MKRTTLALVILLICFLAVGAVEARQRQAGGQNQSVQIKVGGFFPEGGGEFWQETEDVFYLSHDDFDDIVLGFSFVSGFSNYVEVGFNADFYESTIASEYREYVDSEGYPIFHDTTLSLIPLTVDFRFLPTGRYATRGPGGSINVRRPVFYVGGGVGVNLFEYEEIGDFIDFSMEVPEVGYDHFSDSGVAFETHVLAGVELPMGSHSGLLFEGKYSWSDEELGDDFSGLGSLELGGLTVYVGATLQF